MSRPIHGKSTPALKFLRKKPAALAVYWCYVARSNRDGVAWPSGDGLARDTGWDKATCLEGRGLLVELKALEKVEKYIRPPWRGLTGKALAQKLNLDRSEYYRPTGTIAVDGKVYDLLYIGGHDDNDIDNFTDGVPRPPTTRTDMRPDTPELDLSTTELGLNKHKKQLPVAASAPTLPPPADDATTTAETDAFNAWVDQKINTPAPTVSRPKGAAPNPYRADVVALEQGTGTVEEPKRARKSSAPKVDTDPVTAARNKAIGDSIKAWLETTGAIDPAAYQKKPFREMAGALYDAGITADDIRDFCHYRAAKDDFWKGKSYPFTAIGQHYQAWRAANPTYHAPNAAQLAMYEEERRIMQEHEEEQRRIAEHAAKHPPRTASEVLADVMKLVKQRGANDGSDV